MKVIRLLTAPSFSACKPKRSLHFETPKNKGVQQTADNEEFSEKLTPLQSPAPGFNSSLLSPKFSRLSDGTPVGKPRSEKRARNVDEFGDPVNEFSDDLPDLSMWLMFLIEL